MLLALVLAVPASAGTVPYALLQVGNLGPIEIPVVQNLSAGGWFIQNWQYRTSEFEVNVEHASASASGSIAYGIAVVDFGAPSVFGFSFVVPTVSIGSPNVVNASIAGGLTDFSGDGVSMNPIGANIQSSWVGMPLTNMGVDVGPAFAGGTGIPGAFFSYGPYVGGPQPGPGPGPWTLLGVDAFFGLSGNGDIAALTGFSSIEESTAPVPEPASLLLLGTGLIGAAVLRKRRAR